MQPSTANIFGTHTVALLDRIKVPFFRYLLLLAPSSVTLSLVSEIYFPFSLLISDIIIQGISPPKYLGCPLGLGDAPRITFEIFPIFVNTHPAGKLVLCIICISTNLSLILQALHLTPLRFYQV